MSWEAIDLKGVSTQIDLIPEGLYTFELLPGAKYNESGSILAQAAVATDGEFRGKRVLFSYPDPESISSKGKVQSWSAVALKRLEQAIGIDINDGETKTDYLNRVAGSKFQTGIKHNEDDSGQKRMNLQLLNLKPAV